MRPRLDSRLRALRGLSPLLGALAVSAAACLAAPSETKTAMLEETFTLRVGETATIQGESLEIGFLQVTGDSRCPMNAICVWEGDASVRVSLKKGGGTKEERELHTAARFQEGEAGASYAVKLVGLEPFPIAGQTADKATYKATLRVSRE